MTKVGDSDDAYTALTETSWGFDEWGEPGLQAPPVGWEEVGTSTRVVLRPIGGSVVYKLARGMDCPDGLEQNASEVETMAKLMADESPLAVPCSLYRFDEGTVVAMEYVSAQTVSPWDVMSDAQFRALHKGLRDRYGLYDTRSGSNLVVDATGQVRLVDAGC